MKYIALLIFLFGTTCHCFSQVNDNAEDNGQKLLYFKKIEKYRKMRNTGKFFTVVGGILFVGGIVTIVDGAHDYNTAQSVAAQQSGQSKINRGSNAFSIGFLAMGAGIPLWIVGGHSREKYERKLRNLNVSITPVNRGAGLTLAYKF